jgi:hypothetical protein
MKKRKKGYIPLVKEEWKEEGSIVKEEVPTWEKYKEECHLFIEGLCEEEEASM